MLTTRPRSSEHVAAQIAIGALRYFLLKFTRTTVIAFDFQEALSFEGETGPYVQYAAVRARNIAAQDWRSAARRCRISPRNSPREAIGAPTAAEDFWQVLLAARRQARSGRRVAAGEPAHVARYAFQLAQAFNNFYHQYPILSETDREKKRISALDDRFLPRATGAHARDSRHRRPDLHVTLSERQLIESGPSPRERSVKIFSRRSFAMPAADVTATQYSTPPKIAASPSSRKKTNSLSKTDRAQYASTMGNSTTGKHNRISAFIAFVDPP